MKRMMSIAAIALLMAGTSVYACSGCGCSAKKDKAKTECKACKDGKDCKACEAKKGCKACKEGKACKACEGKKSD